MYLLSKDFMGRREADFKHYGLLAKDSASGRLKAAGVIMDLGLTGGIASLACSAAGDANLYFSGGRGILGTSSIDYVAEAAKSMTARAGGCVHLMEKKTAACDFPLQGEVAYWVVTKGGVYAARGHGREMSEGRSPFTALFYMGNEIIDTIRKVSLQRR